MPDPIYQACSNIPGLRHWVENQQSMATGAGCFWLPIVLTAKGPLYGEVIGLAAEFSIQDLSADLGLLKVGVGVPHPYQQPIYISDALRQPLYYLGYQLLSYLQAPPATYLLQFGIENQRIIFDRLWPFPAAPAIASLGVQEPDLFTCHWYCLTGKPIFDLIIVPQ